MRCCRCCSPTASPAFATWAATSSALVEWRREIEAGKLVGPRIVACGPFLADAKPGTPDTIPVSKPAQGRRAVQKVKRQFGDYIKVLNRLSRESYLAIADEAKFQDIPLVGHVPDSITASEASEAGQKSIEHIFYSNLAFDCSAQETELREERAAAAAKKDNAALAKIRIAAEASFDPKKADALWQTFLRNKTWVCPTLVAIHTVAQQREFAAQHRRSAPCLHPARASRQVDSRGRRQRSQRGRREMVGRPSRLRPENRPRHARRRRPDPGRKRFA